MSTPPNRLAQYRSYSYYHVLAICDSTDTADALATITDEDVWLPATPSTAAFNDQFGRPIQGKFSPKQLNGAGYYAILINGAATATYVIETVKWHATTTAQIAPGVGANSVALEGKMVVSEPKGISFLDQIVKTCLAMGVDASNAIYVMKTFFIGHAHSPDKGDYSEVIADITPLSFFTLSATGSFTEAGGTYTIEFVGTSHGASRIPQFGVLNTALTFKAEPSLAATLKKMEREINRKYLEYYYSIVNQISASNMEAEPKTQLLASLRPVEYVIDVGGDYQNPTSGNIAYTVTSQMDQQKDTPGCSTPATVSIPAGTSIEMAIRTVMSMSSQVQLDAAKGDANGVKYDYKVHSTVQSSTPSNDTAKRIYTVYYRVQKIQTPQSLPFDPIFQALNNPDGSSQFENSAQFEVYRRNLIEYDYLYTGKNVDILEFDMNLNLGLHYLQTATLNQTIKTQFEPLPNTQVQVSAHDLANAGTRLGNSRPLTVPVFFGMQIKQPQALNATNPGVAMQSVYTLAKHASLEVQDVTMKVMGNPNLLHSTNRASLTSNVINGLEQPGTDPVQNGDFADWSIVPSMAKVNIRMPRENDDALLFSGRSSSSDPNVSTDYAEPFWFQGYYFVMGIDHEFNGGFFTQTLRMLGIPTFKTTDLLGNADPTVSQPKAVDIDNAAGKEIGKPLNCTDPTRTINSSTRPVTVPETPPSQTTTPTNAIDANTLSAQATELSLVRGWDEASPEVKDAILKASQQYGVSPMLMALTVANESSFNPRAKASTSSASGLFQFISGTWNQYAPQVNSTRVPTKQTVEPTDPRFDPYANSRAGAAFLRDNIRSINSSSPGDVYLAHFLGPGVAKRVIEQCNVNGGEVSVAVAYGTNTKAYEAAKKANASIFNKYPTCKALREWAAVKMSKNLKNAPTVATSSTQPSPLTVIANTQPGLPLPTSTLQATAYTAAQAVYDVTDCTPAKNKPDVSRCNTK